MINLGNVKNTYTVSATNQITISPYTVNLKFGKHLTFVLRKMCEFVNADFDTIDFCSSNWYTKYEWTKEKEKEFYDWMVDYIYRNKDANKEIFERSFHRKKIIKVNVHHFLFMYGWKNISEKTLVLDEILK